MKLATLPSSPLSSNAHRPAEPDGRLVVVSADLRRAVDASSVAPSLAVAITRWDVLEPKLRALADGLENGELVGFGFDPTQALAPLPRAPQWLVGSAFASHLKLLTASAVSTAAAPAAGATTTGATTSGAGRADTRGPMVPPVIRGASDHFGAPTDDVAGYRVDDDIDFNGGFGVIVDEVPAGVGPAEAARHIKLVVLLNDVRLRAPTAREQAAGSGLIHGAPATAFAPVAVTPDELGPAWSGCRIHRRLLVEVNGHWFGHPNGACMTYGFDELVAYCAGTRRLQAGTIIGSGTVSDPDPAMGSACIAERRAWETLARGAAITPFLAFGDRVRLHVDDDEGSSIFGPIDQVCQPLVVLPAAARSG